MVQPQSQLGAVADCYVVGRATLLLSHPSPSGPTDLLLPTLVPKRSWLQQRPLRAKGERQRCRQNPSTNPSKWYVALAFGGTIWPETERDRHSVKHNCWKGTTLFLRCLVGLVCVTSSWIGWQAGMNGKGPPVVILCVVLHEESQGRKQTLESACRRCGTGPSSCPQRIDSSTP